MQVRHWEVLLMSLKTEVALGGSETNEGLITQYTALMSKAAPIKVSTPLCENP